MHNLDLVRLDRTLAQFAAQHARFLRALEGSNAVEHVFEMLPAGLDWELYATLQEQAGRDPLAAPSARWLGFLLVEHACIDARRSLAQAVHRELKALDKPERGPFSFAQLRRLALEDVLRRSAWLGALEAPAERVAAARVALEERRAECGARLVDATLAPESDPRLLRGVETFLVATDDAYRELGIGSFAKMIDGGLGQDVLGSWPARLLPRSIAEWFREAGWLAGLEPTIDRLPQRLGASSWLRALDAFGRALHDAASGKRHPFVLAREPQSQRRATYGALLALLPLEAAFAERRLEVSRVHRADYLRALARVVLIGARQSALRARLRQALGHGTASYRETFEHALPRALGFELPRSTAGAWFASEAGATDFGGLLLAAARHERLIQNHDEDWFRNPRAVEELREELEMPQTAAASDGAFEAGVGALSERLITRL
jgi:hypothetical protein